MVYDTGMEPSETQVVRPDLNTLSLSEFAQYLRESGHIHRLLSLACDEDLGDPAHDWTGELMFAPSDRCAVEMRARESGIIAGLEFLPDLVNALSEPGQIEWEAACRDGDAVEPGAVLAKLEGNARAIVRLERTMLNLISRLCGIATRTNKFVSLVEGTDAKICDTRKTTPGLRAFEKYAVRCGGGTTHRMGLHDAVLIKDNHLAGIAGSDLAERIQAAASKISETDAKLWFVQVEVDTIEQLKQVLGVRAGVVDIVLLDNMNPEQLKQAVELRDRSAAGLLLEASGGVSEQSAHAIALSGVDRISIGGLTHQATSIDIGLDSV